jgi:hypothetical protein
MSEQGLLQRLQFLDQRITNAQVETKRKLDSLAEDLDQVKALLAQILRKIA